MIIQINIVNIIDILDSEDTMVLLNQAWFLRITLSFSQLDRRLPLTITSAKLFSVPKCCCFFHSVNNALFTLYIVCFLATYDL